MIEKETLYTLSDITIVPKTVSTINSRSECYLYCNNLEKTNGLSLPVVVAPMSSIIDDKNYKLFSDNGLSCVIPRNISIEKRLELCKELFCAFSLSEVEDYFINNKMTEVNKIYILIDIANGHMNREIQVGKLLKNIYSDRLLLMGGNIANPDTYELYNDSGFDYVRVGIAGGSQCLTGTQTGVYYPMASLIDNTVKKKNLLNGKTKIVADGGIGSYSDAIKCLALGADYVMMGKVFAKTEEACGEILIDENTGEKYRLYYGMSTKKAQSEIKTKEDNKKLKTSEGKISKVNVEYTVSGWVDNFKSYLRSTMSYTGSLTLDHFRKYTRCQVISNESSISVNSK